MTTQRAHIEAILKLEQVAAENEQLRQRIKKLEETCVNHAQIENALSARIKELELENESYAFDIIRART